MCTVLNDISFVKMHKVKTWPIALGSVHNGYKKSQMKLLAVKFVPVVIAVNDFPARKSCIATGRPF